MMDITDYFKSSPDDVNNQKSLAENVEISKKPPENEGEVSKTTPKSRRRDKKLFVNESEVSLNTPKSKNSGTKSRKSPKRMNKRSPLRSPLEAYNKLFNVGKKSSLEKDNSNSRMEKNDNVEIQESISLDDELSPGVQKSSETIQSNESKVNAFQFLMMSRNKVIGTNSPGKEIEELSEQDTVQKCSQKLLARKRLLHSWSDSIQAKKRKLDDEEVDKYIKVKLNTRKERLISLLHIDDNSVDEKEITPKSKRKKHSLINKNTEKNTNTESGTILNGTAKIVSKKVHKDRKNINKKPDKGETPLSSGDDFEMKDSNDTEINTPKTSKSHKHKRISKDAPTLVMTPRSKGKIRNDSDRSTPKTSKTHIHKKISEEISTVEITPRSKWKMKIKLVNYDVDTKSGGKGDVDDVIGLSKNYNHIEVNENMDCLSGYTAKINKKNDNGERSENNDEEIFIDENESRVLQSADITEINETNGINVLDTSKTTVETNDCQNRIINCQPIDLLESGQEIPQAEDKNGRVLRSRTNLNVNKKMDYVYSSSEESDDEVKIKSNKKALKIAPVFIKAMPKPKIDPAVLEARRKFLMSEMPDELRKRVEKLPTSNGHNIDIDFDVFPKVSHVCQEDKSNPLWNLEDPCLEIKTSTSFNYESVQLFCKSLIDKSVVKKSRFEESEPIKNIKTILMDLKLQHKNYPVNRAFRLLKEKNGLKIELSTKKTSPKRKPRKSHEKKEKISVDVQNNVKHLMWTEKYKPRSSEDFLGNIQAVSSLKKWLERWREVLESGKRKRKQYCNDSDTEFISSDAESVYDRSLPTTVILNGPCGSGKSCSVYAVCHELGLNVLELNASSRRTGKQVLQELQEATRSHQVRKNKGVFESLTKKGISSNPEKVEEKSKSRRMCVLLIEDIDIVFEQDDGFISAISQISATSKRPIVLTTSNENSVYAQKFLSEFKTIRFHSLSVKNLGVWLQILCVLEGIFIDLSSIGELLEYNRGDIRKTLLELQYWTQSGGQINKSNTLLDPLFEIQGSNEEDNEIPIFDDAPISLKELDEKLDDYRIHSNILSDFESFQSFRFNNIPTTIDLKTLWWNIPKFLCPIKPKPSSPSSKKSKTKTKKRLKLVSDMYESAAIFDVSYRKSGYKCDKPICTTRWHNQLQDSLELEEKFNTSSFNQDILELNHYLTDTYLSSCKKRFIYESSENQRFLNMAAPGLEKERQLENNHKYEKELLSPVPLHNSLDRKSVALDYLPSLRTIARTECRRAKNTVKRHNRFYNYLQNLNITCDTPILDFATQTFSINGCPE